MTCQDYPYNLPKPFLAYNHVAGNIYQSKIEYGEVKLPDSWSQTLNEYLHRHKFVFYIAFYYNI
ncbi:hypothetical protein HanXRQr2_Chr11g0499741 [Helianthus annuus]|uniref:Uncharacterized protein n=1 Tax=Helianthus annuus TaxID=4232 RepID=A0A9K3N0P5_HELAN|nr:hypothetical protein HanXRQr2_Chr11g0499741 [Helianthus annuus]KAJ0875853.1 hypothetical protein HanPSC8_Chr11g0481461 [Helianthus annuus]